MHCVKKSWWSGTWLAVSLVAFGVGIGVPLTGVAGPYDSAAASGTNWLTSQRNVSDGSWGATDDVKYVRTSEAVFALAALNQLTPAYYAGVAWLGNHTPANVDFTARRLLAMGPASGAVSQDLSALLAAQNLAATGNNGWGLSGVYQGAPLDTSLSLQALNQQGAGTSMASAVSYLLGAQLTGSDRGWALGQESNSDPVTTAHVIQALVPLVSVNAGVSAAISNGLMTLNGKVGTTSPVPEMALTAMANLRNSSSSVQGLALLNALVVQQSSDGSWGGDTYATSLALRALAMGLGSDLAAQKIAVSMMDNNLRAAVNANLGHGALDAISRGQLAQLTSLDIAGRNVQTLTGLEWAVNLTSLSAANNNISSAAPLANLALLTQVDLSGNAVTLQPTATVLTPSANPVNKTVPINLTARVTGSRPIGTVQFYDGDNLIGSVTLNANSPQVTSASSAFLLNVPLAGGFRRLKAAYSGDARNAPSTSDFIVEMVNPDAAATLNIILDLLNDD